MIRESRAGLAAPALALALLLAAALMAGCARDPGPSPVTTASTALGGLEAARSKLSTTAPDAKLLVVQTAEATVATATPSWVYLFGSPSTGRAYAVYTVDGEPKDAEEYGSAALDDSEWSKVPDSDAWTVDSDVAYEKALAAAGAKGDPAGYIMGLVTFIPETEASQVEPFVWNVQFDPGASGATTSTIEVDARTGATKVIE